MKHLTLVKQHPCVQLAHLYEHMFMRSINELFYSNGAFKNLDYSARGVAYEQGGIIIIYIDLYTEKARSLSHRLEDLFIDYGANKLHLSTEILRIMTEEDYELEFDLEDINRDDGPLLQELDKLHQLPWQHLDQLDIIDSKSIQLAKSPITLTNYPQAKPEEVLVAIEINNKYHHLAAVFSELSRIMLFTISFRLCSNYGLYEDDITGSASPLATTAHLNILPAETHRINLTETQNLIRDTLSHMVNSGIKTRLADYLNNLSYSNHPYDAPDNERILTEYGILVGSSGWKKLATTENIDLLLNNCKFTLKLKDQNLSFELP